MLRRLVIYLGKKNEEKILAEYTQDFLFLRDEMARRNVEMQLNFVEENSNSDRNADIGIHANQKIHIDKSIFIDRSKEDELYITDIPKVFDGLKHKGNYVIALTHKYNQNSKYKDACYLIEGLEGLNYNYLNRVYQRFAGLPWDILETEHLKVRESMVEDVEDFYRIYKEPSITYYMDDLFKEADMERAYIKNYARYVYGFYGFGLWTVLLKETGQVIGRAGLSIRDGYDLPELGFVIDVAYQGKGYAAEVCQAILLYAWNELEMESLQALVHASNEASIALLKKLGFMYLKEVEENGKNYQLWIVRKK